MDFLNEENVCGQNFLKLVSRGSAIIAELLRLSDNIPKVFFGYTSEAKKYNLVIFDFEYLKNSDFFEEKIQNNPEVIELDETFRENYVLLLERFHVLFESIYKYYTDLQALIEEVKDTVYIQYTIEGILQQQEGKKLMAEAYYLYGCMLLLLDSLIMGSIREKIIISFIRYKGGSNALNNINEICRLCRSTGYLAPQFNNGVTKKPANYPEEYFARFPVDREVIKAVINAIQDDDIYQQISAYPTSEHRSVGLSNQASILYVIMYFDLKILESQNTKMREIVDKHFSDNWVLPYYMGYVVDLSVQWEPYKAARIALGNTLQQDHVRELIQRYQKKLEDCTKKIKEYLQEGILNEDFVLDKIQTLVQALRDANVTVRWLLLHKKTGHKKAREMLDPISPNDILTLLLLVSQFEFVIKKMFENLIETKQKRWDADKNSSCEKMMELAEYFSGNRPLSNKVSPDANYQQYFLEIHKHISSLTYSDSTYAGRKINSLIKALEDIEQYYQISNNLQIKSYLIETRMNLKHMVRTVYIKKQVLVHLAQISDFSYAWQCLKEFVKLMQQSIKNDPSCALLLRATFVKLSSIMNTPMIRIIQANSPDLMSVSKYYSGELIKFVKQVLQIIPTSVFDILEEIIVLLTSKIKKVPLKINREDLKEFSQFEERYKMAKLTHQISVFTESILVMETYLIGVIEVDPKMILEDGIRREVVNLMCNFLEKVLVFNQGTVEDFEKRMIKLSQGLTGFKSAFEYIQDFINIYGIKIWQEEFNRLINRYIDLEANSFLSKKMTIEEILDNEEYIPPPLFSDSQSVNFMGRLVRELLNLTDPKRTIYIDYTSTFYDGTTFKESINMKTFWLIRKCIGISGLNGLDKLLSFMIVFQMKNLAKLIKKEMDQNWKILSDLYDEVKNISTTIDKYEKVITTARKSNIKNIFINAIVIIQKIGQMIILRRLINRQLSSSARICSDKLYLSLENLNNSILNDIMHKRVGRKEYEAQTEAENSMCYELTKIMSYAGLNDPIKKIYFTCSPLENIPFFLFLLLQYYIPSFQYDKKVAALLKKQKNESLDATQLLLGIMSFLNQFHPSKTQVFLGLIGQMLKSTINYNVQIKESKVQGEFSNETICNLVFFEEFIRFSGEKMDYAENFLPLDLMCSPEQNKTQNQLKRQLLENKNDLENCMISISNLIVIGYVSFLHLNRHHDKLNSYIGLINIHKPSSNHNHHHRITKSDFLRISSM